MSIFNFVSDLEQSRKAKAHVWFFGLDNEQESVNSAIKTVSALDNEIVVHRCILTREQIAKPKETFTMKRQKLKEDDCKEIRLKAIKTTYLELSTLAPSELVPNMVPIEAPKPQEASLPVISKHDLVVLCVELSGRMLITGKNGIFNAFVKEIMELTDQLVLFVDRLDRMDKIPEEKAEVQVQVKPQARVWYGDTLDKQLDAELQQSQKIETYFTHRMYYYAKRDGNDGLQEVWQSVVCKPAVTS